MVCCLLHARLASVLSVSATFWVVILLSFLCPSFFYVFWTGCLPAPFEQRHDPYFIFDFHLIFFIVNGVTFHGESVGVSGFLSLHFCMGGIVLSAAYSNCCP